MDLVLVLDLKAWRYDRIASGANVVTLDHLLECSVVPISETALEAMQRATSATSKLFWIVDGVNELPSDVSSLVLEALLKLIRGSVHSSLVVSDRSPTKYAGAGWRLISLEPLADAEVNQRLPAEGGREPDGPGRRDLLRTPFFLEVALSDGDWSWTTSVQAIHSLFAKRLRLGEDDIDVLSDFALTTYVTGNGLSFALEDLASVVSFEVARSLIEARIVQTVQDGTLVFYHQLLHDYLASRSVARHVETWIPRYFDAISFDANSYESLLMVLEQLKTEDTFSSYIIALYDWNWFATIRCVERALREGWQVPHHLAVVLAAMLGEKRFDPVEGSRDRAERWTAKLDQVTGFRFGQAVTLTGLVDEVDRVRGDSGPDWFQAWYQLFNLLRDSSKRPSEEDLNAICNPDPFIGWTAAQIARHCDIGPEGQRQIRAIYRGARFGEDDRSRSTRWRAVHALGRRPSEANAALLLDAIDHDDYTWVTYGAVRSLLEMAVLADDESTSRFLSDLDARLHVLPAEPLSQVAWATRYKGAPAGWPARVTPLLEHAYSLQDNEEERERWKSRMEAFKTWATREASG
ncbi:HEAT repeat domain-containing protein [Actinoplanes sp. NPDC026619]|uniref:HEAT repeat domain-containing protein n=1 Tax=Actinoplanes sp. NPDC026619 TaxID=3155798 RepID=UPI00340BD71A